MTGTASIQALIHADNGASIWDGNRTRASSDMHELQITMSPFYGKTDFSPLAGAGTAGESLDLVSIADLLRNGFVYPPHSVLNNVKLVTFSFDPQEDMRAVPQFRFAFRDSSGPGSGSGSSEHLIDTYHRLLCDALVASCADMQAPWLLQSGGKDSSTLAIAAAEVRPDTTCITYLGGSEENEVSSAHLVARTLGLRHETLVCDSGRAYDRYVKIVDRMPLLTADFALLSYVDLATTIADNGGDGVIDGLGSDNYFGVFLQRRLRWLSRMARNLRFPPQITELPIVGRSFELCYLLSTLQMDPIERVFPGSRFTDDEVDELLGRRLAVESKQRLSLFREEMATATSLEEWWAMASSIAGSAGAVGKGLFTTNALALSVAYPFCDRHLREWVHRELPAEQRIDAVSRTNKVLVRRHIARHFARLPYVDRKGSFRFDLRGLARCRFEQVHAYAGLARDVLPGASAWLERNRRLLDNKYHASRFYLLAVVLPWITQRSNGVPP